MGTLHPALLGPVKGHWPIVDWPPEGQVSTPGPVGCGPGDRVCAVKRGPKYVDVSNRISV